MGKQKVRIKRIGDTSEVLTPLQELEVCKSIRESIVEGTQRTKVIEKIQSEYPELSVPHIEKLITNTVDFLSSNIYESDELQNIVTLHVEKYEELYDWFKRMDLFSNMNQVLFAKERLLGYHRRETNIEISQENNTLVVEESVDLEYNLNKLSESERVEFQELLNKIKVA